MLLFAVNWIAWSFFGYTILVMLFGVISARFATKSSTDFFLADRGLGPWVAALSASASAESGWVTLGLVLISGFHYLGRTARWLAWPEAVMCSAMPLKAPHKFF